VCKDKKIKNCPIRASLDPVADRDAAVTLLSKVQSLFALVEGLREAPTSTAVELAARGGQVIDATAEVINAAVPFLNDPSFVSAWTRMQPELIAIRELLTGQTSEGVRDALQAAKSFLPKTQEFTSLQATIALTADLGSARTSQDVQVALESAAGPVGSWKQAHHHLTLRIAGFAGLTGGYERPTVGTSPSLMGNFAGGGFAPVGFDISGPISDSFSLGILVSAVDVGQLLTSPISPSTPVATAPTPQMAEAGGDVKLIQVLSPGLYGHLGLWNSPITVGAGVAVAPLLRSYTLEGTSDVTQYSMWRFNIFLAVDIGVLPIYSGHDSSNQKPSPPADAAVAKAD